MSEPLDLGTVATPEDAAALIEASISDFLRAGGRFSWGEWVQMDGITRAAAVSAGDRVTEEWAETLIDAAVDRLNASDEDARAEAVLDEAEALLG